jgi:hypothetical protein
MKKSNRVIASEFISKEGSKATRKSDISLETAYSGAVQSLRDLAIAVRAAIGIERTGTPPGPGE